MSTPDHRCERCRKRHLAEFVWLELDTERGTYHEPGTVPRERSQGLFPFGVQCAVQELKRHTKVEGK